MRTSNVTRHEDESRRGFHYTVDVTVGGVTRTYNDRFGSWRTERTERDAHWPEGSAAQHAPTWIAYELARVVNDDRADRGERVPKYTYPEG